jgi:hypothetical protein
MADDVAAAMVLTMDDGELSSYIASLRARLGELPQGDPRRDPLLMAYGRACGEYNRRGLPDFGGTP